MGEGIADARVVGVVDVRPVLNARDEVVPLKFQDGGVVPRADGGGAGPIFVELLHLAHHVGRVEHVVSGEMTRFHSLDELLAFMRRVLLQVEHDTDLQ